MTLWFDAECGDGDAVIAAPSFCASGGHHPRSASRTQGVNVQNGPGASSLKSMERKHSRTWS